MTVTVIYAEMDKYISSGAYVAGQSAEGTGYGIFSYASSSTISAGARFNGASYSCDQAFLRFDTSSIGYDVTDVLLSIFGHSDSSVVDADLVVRAVVWDGGPGPSDFVKGSDLSSLVKVANLNTASYLDSYFSFDSTDNFKDAIVGGGFTSLMIHYANQEYGLGATASEYINFKSKRNIGSSQDPKLIITHELPAPPVVTAAILL
ncbi:hypothetical protein [Kiloniella laminariae]|uniref:hypothetical protein n=1 Tax=Kiloniella laminariae TaxID=454162 RepID=UPI00036612D3|nr:hypothetical protein [Kiloniella laminariae]